MTSPPLLIIVVLFQTEARPTHLGHIVSALAISHLGAFPPRSVFGPATTPVCWRFDGRWLGGGPLLAPANCKVAILVHSCRPSNRRSRPYRKSKLRHDRSEKCLAKNRNVAYDVSIGRAKIRSPARLFEILGIPWSPMGHAQIPRGSRCKPRKSSIPRPGFRRPAAQLARSRRPSRAVDGGTRRPRPAVTIRR